MLAYSLQAAAGNALADSEMNAKSGANKTDDKGAEAKYTNHSLDEVASMVCATVSVFDTKVHYLLHAGKICLLTMILNTLHLVL